MDSAEDYFRGHMIPFGSSWQDRPAAHYPYMPQPIAFGPGPATYNLYGAGQGEPGPTAPAPVPQTYPPVSGFTGQSPSPPVPTESLKHLKQALTKIQELPQMADPLSLMASLIAVATAGIQVSRTLYAFAGAVGGASEEITSVGKEISAFSGVLRDLHDFLDDAKDLISKSALANANRILEDCKGVFAKIQRMLDSCNSGGRSNFWQSLQWSFRRDKVKPMCAKLESFKLTLTILLSTMRLARCKQEVAGSKSPTSSSKESRYRENLETDILNNSAALARWQQAESELESAHHRHPGHPYLTLGAPPKPPSKELEWLANLVPYKPSPPPRTHTAAPYLLSLPPIPETPDRLDRQAKVQIIRTVDVLLAKWTTLTVSELRRPESRRQDSPQRNHRQTSRIRRPTVEESVDTAEPDSDQAPGETLQPPSTGVTATVPEAPMLRRASESNEDAPTTQPDSPRSAHAEPVPLPPDSVGRNEADRGGSKEGGSKEETTDPPSTITVEYPEEEEELSEKGFGNGDENSDDDSAVSNHSSTGIRINFGSGPSIPSSPASEDGWTYPPYPPPREPYSIPPYEHSPYGAPPNRPSSYFPVGYAPSFYPHMGYGPQQPLGFAQTVVEPLSNGPAPRMSPAVPGPGQGTYPGFYPYPIPPPAPAPAPPPQADTDGHHDGHVDTLGKKVEALEKLLQEAKLMNNAQAEKLLQQQEAREIARVRKEDEDRAAHHAKQKEEAELRAKEEAESRIIRFKDAIGRKFAFPYRQCKRWRDMETLIEQAFTNIDNSELVDHVRKGHFDLVDPSGALVLPSLWETVVEPDWTVTMHMWPAPRNSVLRTPAPSPLPAGPQPIPSKAVPPAAPMPPPAVLEPRPRHGGRERVIVEPRDRVSHREADSVAESMSTEEESDHSYGKSTYQEVLTESFMRHEQQFEETWEAVMARSRAKAQKTILEMWLSESEAQLRELELSPSREQSARGRGRNTADTPTDNKNDSHRETVLGSGNQTLEECPRPAGARPAGQWQPPLPMTNGLRSPTVCQSCQSPLSLGTVDQQTPVANQTDSSRSLGEEIQHISHPQDSLHSILERRIETLEGLIKRQVADRQARLEKAKNAENEQRLGRLEKAVVENGVQTPPLTPTRSEPSPTLPTEYLSPRPTTSRSGSGPASNGSRSSFRKRIFGRSASLSAAVA